MIYLSLRSKNRYLLSQNIYWIGISRYEEHSELFAIKQNDVWEGTIESAEVLSEKLSPWIAPLLVYPDERGNHYGKPLLDYVRKKAGRSGYRIIYLTTGEIGYYEKYGFREVGLTTFTWGRPTKVYETDAIFELEERE